MSASFDGYYKWLAIPPEEQPPDHYRLLGVKRFEPDLDVIESAADQRMAHLRNYQSGRHAALSQKLLNEVAAAKLALLTPDKRAEYDAQLRRQLEERPLPKAAPLGGSPPLPTAAPIEAPPAGAAPAPGAVPTPVPASPAASSPAPIAVAPVITPVAQGGVPAPRSGSAYGASGKPGSTPRGAKKPVKWMLPMLITGGMAGVLGLLLCAAGLYALLAPPEDEVVANPRATVNVRPGGDVVTPPPETDGDETSNTDGDGNDSGTDGNTDGESDGNTDGTTDGDADGSNNVTPPPDPDPMPPEPDPMPPPDPAPKPAPDPDPKPELPKPAAPRKPALPSPAAQTAALAKVNEVMKLDAAATDEEKVAKADEMIRLARSSATQTDERFALLRRAAELARDAGDAAVMLRAFDEMDEAFEFDADRARGAFLAALAADVREPAAVELLVTNSERFLDEAVLRDRVDIAMNLADVLHTKVPSKGTVGKSYRKQLNDRYQRLRKLHTAWKRAQDARAALESNADDPAANLAVGRYLCLTRGDFPAGVEHLAKSDDAALQDAAKKDLAARDAGDAAAGLAAGDAWYALAEANKQDEGFYARAHHFYTRMEGELGALDKLRIDGRLESIAKNETAQRLIQGAAAIARLDEDAPMRAVARQVATLSAGSSGAVKLAFLPDGKTLVTGGSDGALKFWDIESQAQQPTATYPAHQGRINDVAVSSDGLIVTVGSDDNALLWNDKGEKALVAHSDRSYFNMAGFAPDGKLVLARSGDVSFWDARKARLLGTLKTDGRYFEDVSFGEDKVMAFTGSGKVALLGPGGPIPPVDPAQESAQAAVFSPDGNLLAIASNNGKVLVYDDAQRESRTLDSYPSVRCIAFLPDGRTLAAASGDYVQLLDVETGAPWQSVDSDHYIYGLAISADGKRMATAGSDGSIVVWEIERERILAEPPTKADLPGSDEPGARWVLRGTLDFGSNVNDVKFSPDGTRLAVTDRSVVRIYDALHGAPLASLSGHQQEVQRLAWSADSQRLASTSYDHTTRIWDVAGRRELGQVHSVRAPKAICFSPNGRRLLVAADDGARFYPVPAGDTSTSLDLGAGSSVYSAAAAPDASAFALSVRGLTSSRPRLGVYGFDDSSPKATFSDSHVLAVAPGGTHIVAYDSSSTLHVYAADAQRPVSSLRMSGIARAAAFHPSKKMVAVGNYDHAVSLWDAATGKLILALSGHADGVTAVEFSSDGKSLATASGDKTVKIWSPKKATTP